VPGIAGLLGEHSLAAITIANSIHLMDHDQLLRQAGRCFAPERVIAVLSNGRPPDRGFRCLVLLARALVQGQTDLRLRHRPEVPRPRRGLKAAGNADVRKTVPVDYEDVLDLDQVSERG